MEAKKTIINEEDFKKEMEESLVTQETLNSRNDLGSNNHSDDQVHSQIVDYDGTFTTHVPYGWTGRDGKSVTSPKK